MTCSCLTPSPILSCVFILYYKTVYLSLSLFSSQLSHFTLFFHCLFLINILVNLSFLKKLFRIFSLSLKFFGSPVRLTQEITRIHFVLPGYRLVNALNCNHNESSLFNQQYQKILMNHILVFYEYFLVITQLLTFLFCLKNLTIMKALIHVDINLKFLLVFDVSHVYFSLFKETKLAIFL